jgi:fucose 4-O-acetylase-like acetyltransferase
MEPVVSLKPVPAEVVVRNDFIDYLKGTLIFLVVCGHLIQFLSYGDNPSFYLNPLFMAIYMFHMPLFMAVSGFVSFRSISNTTFWFGVRRRIQQIIIPAICWPILYLGASLLWFILYQGTLAGGMHLFMKSLPSFRPGLWFLWAVFGSMLVVSAFKFFQRDRLEFFLAATLLFLFAPDGADIYLFKYTFPFFCLGYALAKGDQIRIPKNVSPPLVATVFMASIVCYLLWRTNTYIYVTKMHLSPSNLYNIGLRYFAGVTMSAAFLLLMLFFYRIAKSKTLSNWGQHSLDIYIIHLYCVVGLGAFAMSLKNSLWSSFLVAPVLAGILCAVTCQIGIGIGKIPVARTLLLGKTRRHEIPGALKS